MSSIMDLGFYIAETVTSFQEVKIHKEKKNSIVFETVLQDFDYNRNLRMYEKDPLTKAIFKDDRIIDLIERKSWYGEAGHPISDDLRRIADVDQRNISHIILERSLDSDKIMGLVESANTVIGRDMKGLCEQGSKLAFSMRGFGKTRVLKESSGQEKTIVTSPIRVITYDWVMFPSHAKAIMTRLRENAISNISFKDTMVALNESDVRSFLSGTSNNYTLMESFLLEQGFSKDAFTVSINDNDMIIRHDQGTHKIALEKEVRKKLHSLL